MSILDDLEQQAAEDLARGHELEEELVRACEEIEKGDEEVELDLDDDDIEEIRAELALLSTEAAATPRTTTRTATRLLRAATAR